jgi:hypothetical protein
MAGLRHVAEDFCSIALGRDAIELLAVLEYD